MIRIASGSVATYRRRRLAVRAFGGIALLLSALLLIVRARPAISFCSPPAGPRLEGSVEGVHDPSIAKQGATYYLFSTDLRNPGHLPIRCSNDLETWTLCGRVFDSIPAWIGQAIPGIKGLWAPDISYFAGKYHLYYAASSFGKNRSIIALATNQTLDPSSSQYRWVDEGPVIESHPEDIWNAIDPNLVLDNKGQAWLAFGSFWSGIKMRRIDPATGKASAADPTLYSLASRSNQPPGAIEAPFVFRHAGFYYLFVSFDFCCRGARSTYNIRAGRATEPTGPYVDKAGLPMMSGGGTLLLEGNSDWRGPGGQSLLHDPSADIIVFHAYSAASGHPFLQIGRLAWSDDWPQIASWQQP